MSTSAGQAASRPSGGSTVTGSTTNELESATNNFALLRLANGPLLGPVLWRVLSMMLARSNWPLDRLDDALLVCDALCAHAPAHASDGRLTFSVQANEEAAELRVLGLTDDGAALVLQDAMLPVVGNVLEHVAERISIEPDDHRDGAQMVIVLSAS